MTETRKCEQCGTLFAPRREHARFCSARCRVAWNRQHAGDPPDRGERARLDHYRDAGHDRPAAAGPGLGPAARLTPRSARPCGGSPWSTPPWCATTRTSTTPCWRATTRPSARSSRARSAGCGSCGTGWAITSTTPTSSSRSAPPGAPARARSRPGRWRSLPEPVLAGLPARGQEWEMTRYREYQARLAGPAGRRDVRPRGGLPAPGLGRGLRQRTPHRASSALARIAGGRGGRSPRARR